MKRRILCLVLAVAMILPMQVFAARKADGDSQKISSNSILRAPMYIDVTEYKTYYSRSSIPSTYYENDYWVGSTKFSGTLYLQNVTVNYSNGKIFSYTAEFSGTLHGNS